MSQSDHIKHLKLATELKQQIDFAPVLEEKNYTLFKEYSIMNSIKNTSKRYGQLSTPNINPIFETQQAEVDNCPTFIVCHNTNQRPNRTPLSNVYYLPYPPIHPFIKQKNNNKCMGCCYDSSLNKTNDYNKWNTGCSNSRLVKTLCNCKKL